jgi:hypothetical protein
VNVKTYFKHSGEAVKQENIHTQPSKITLTSNTNIYFIPYTFRSSTTISHTTTPHTEESQKKKKTLLGAVPFMSHVRQRWNHFQNKFMVIELNLAS